MARQGIKSVVVFHGDVCLGEAEAFPSTKSPSFQFPSNEIRITQLSPPSERCPPLSVLQTISPFSVRCKIQAKSAINDAPISRLYLSCFQEFKTAFMVIGDEEIHLVAMPSKFEKSPCFWCCSVRPGLYNSCLGMLNLRCLAIVFDLDETLIVANTMKSFEDRIDALSRRIDSENDPVKVSGMSAELKRYIEDKEMLRQYAESDTVLDNGRLISVQNELVPLLPGGMEPIKRPVIRLQERNIVLTRVNPEMANTVPVLCVARNVACNVRGGFFKEFDEILLRRVFELCYENDIPDLPCAPDVGDYLMSEDTGSVVNSNRDLPLTDGINGSEAKHKFHGPAYLVTEQPIHRQAQATQCMPSDDDGSMNRAAANRAESLPLLPSFLLITVLQEIGRRCDSKVEFRPAAGSSKDLHFTIEVLFSTEKIGIGMGRTRKEAQLQAAENALRNLASGYLSFIAPNVEAVKTENISPENENGFLEDYTDTMLDTSSKNELLPSTSLNGQLGQSNSIERLSSVVSGIKDIGGKTWSSKKFP